jgi:hypothetical protein
MRDTLRFLALTIVVALVVPSAVARQPAVQSQTSVIAAELADKPVDIPGLNVSIRLPVGAIAESSGVGLDSRLNVKSSSDPSKVEWLLQAFASVSRDVTLTPATVLDSIIEKRRGGQTAVNPATRRRMEVRAFDRIDNLIINGHQVSRVYLDVPEATNLPTSGYTVFMPTPGTFVIFQFDCPPGNVATARPIIETALATTTFRDQKVENALRRHGIEEARQFLASLTPEDLAAAMPSEPALFRLFKAGPNTSNAAGPVDGDLEVGYQKITLRKGQAGEVSNSDKLKWSRDDREFGLLGKIEARGLVFPPGAEALAAEEKPEPRAVVDSVSVFWLSNDRRTETGSVINVVKRGEKSDTYVQTFVRRGERLTVQSNTPGQEPKSQDYDKLPDGYISRVELLLLPRLVAMKNGAAAAGEEAAGAEPVVFNLYSFDFTAGKLAMRRDEFTREVSGDASKAGGWSWLSLPYEGQPDRKVEARIDSAGNILTRVADGVTTQAIEGKALLKLWQDRKLPIDGK